MCGLKIIHSGASSTSHTAQNHAEHAPPLFFSFSRASPGGVNGPRRPRARVAVGGGDRVPRLLSRGSSPRRHGVAEGVAEGVERAVRVGITVRGRYGR